MFVRFGPFFKLKHMKLRTLEVKKKAIKVRAADGMMHTVFYYTVLLVLKLGQLIATQIWEFCYSYD